MSEVLTEPPEEEGDNQKAAEGTEGESAFEAELEDTPELEDSDDDESDS